jgi:hypothetical protein
MRSAPRPPLRGRRRFRPPGPRLARAPLSSACPRPEPRAAALQASLYCLFLTAHLLRRELRLWTCLNPSNGPTKPPNATAQRQPPCRAPPRVSALALQAPSYPSSPPSIARVCAIYQPSRPPGRGCAVCAPACQPRVRRPVLPPAAARNAAARGRARACSGPLPIRTLPSPVGASWPQLPELLSPAWSMLPCPHKVPPLPAPAPCQGADTSTALPTFLTGPVDATHKEALASLRPLVDVPPGGKPTSSAQCKRRRASAPKPKACAAGRAPRPRTPPHATARAWHLPPVARRPSRTGAPALPCSQRPCGAAALPPDGRTRRARCRRRAAALESAPVWRPSASVRNPTPQGPGAGLPPARRRPAAPLPPQYPTPAPRCAPRPSICPACPCRPVAPPPSAHALQTPPGPGAPGARARARTHRRAGAPARARARKHCQWATDFRPPGRNPKPAPPPEPPLGPVFSSVA